MTALFSIPYMAEPTTKNGIYIFSVVSHWHRDFEPILGTGFDKNALTHYWWAQIVYNSSLDAKILCYELVYSTNFIVTFTILASLYRIQKTFRCNKTTFSSSFFEFWYNKYEKSNYIFKAGLAGGRYEEIDRFGPSSAVCMLSKYIKMCQKGLCICISSNL